MPSFIDIATLTKRATITGQEEFQVSATEKVTSEQLAKFAQMLTGFSAINTTDGVINGESNLFEALQVLYKLSSGNGKIRMLNGGSTFGFAYCDSYMSGFIVEVEIGQVYWIMDDNSFNGDYSTATDYGIINVIRNYGNSAQLGCIPITNWNDIFNNFYATGTRINEKTNIVPVISTSNPSSGPQTTTPYIGFALIISSTLPYKVAYFVADGNGDFHYAFVKQTNINSPAEDITWHKLGSSGGGSVQPIIVGDGENVGTVISACKEFEGNNKEGVLVPIYIAPTSNIYDILTTIYDMGFNKAESTICGYAQYVYDGGDYYHIGVSLLIYESSFDRPKYRVEFVVNNSGDVSVDNCIPIGTPHAPIPGFNKILSLPKQININLTTGSTGTLEFNTEISKFATLFITAEVRSSTSLNATVRPVCIPVSFFNPEAAATMMDLCTRTLASGTGIGQIRLNIQSVINGDNGGIKGLVCIIGAANNLANPGDVLKITAVYANV